jgi:preprotein translocase subunit SecD
VTCAPRLREKNVRHGGISRNGQTIEVRFRDWQTLDARRRLIADQFADLQTVDAPDGVEYKLTATHQAEAARRACRSRRSSRTSSRCTTGSTSWAWPSR